MNTKRLLWARSSCTDNRNMSVGKEEWSNSKQSSWNTLPFIIMLQIWLRRGCCELDPVDLLIEICQLTSQLDQVQKHLFEHIPIFFITSVIMLFYVVELCFVPFFFYVIHYENPPKIKLIHSLGRFKLYNPKMFWEFQSIESEPS